MPRAYPPRSSLPDLWPLSEPVGEHVVTSVTGAQTEGGHRFLDATSSLPIGLNFARQDYLALTRSPLASHPVADAIATVSCLEGRLASFLSMRAARTYASGSAALRAALLGLLRPEDHIIVDAGAPLAMATAARSSGARVYLSPPGSPEAVERRLRRLKAEKGKGRLFVAVPSIAPMTSITADLADLRQLCAAFGAMLIADVSHDLGTTAPAGRGIAELQGCLGLVDVVVGSFAKSFGASGGFVVVSDSGLLRQLAPSPPLSPESAGRLLAALHLIDGPEGRRRRRCLHGIILRLRNHLMADGLRVMGQPSPIVPIPLPLASAQAMTTLLRSAGPVVQLMQSPLVARHAPRWRILLAADHGPADIDDLAELIRDVSRSFGRTCRLSRHAAMQQLRA